MTLKPVKIHFLGYALSRAPHIAKTEKTYFISFNALDFLELDVDRILVKCEDDQLFGPIVKTINGEEKVIQIMRHS